jgi:hypothetical protein
MLTPKEITAQIRADLKKQFPDWTFSVRQDCYSMGFSIYVTIKKAPLKLLPEGKTNAEVNKYHLHDYPHAKELGEIIQIANKHNWDNSRPEIDYFDVNYYLTVKIGSYDKPFIYKS